MAVDVALAETLEQIRAQVPDTFSVRPRVHPLELFQGERAHVRELTAGTEVCKFVLGTGNETNVQLVVLQQQAGHGMAGIVHEATEHTQKSTSPYPHRYKFDNGRPVSETDGAVILGKLAARKKSRQQVLGTFGFGSTILY